MNSEDIVAFINSHNLKLISHEETISVVTEYGTFTGSTVDEAVEKAAKDSGSHLTKKTAKEYIVDICDSTGSETKVCWAATPDDIAKQFVEAHGNWEDAFRIAKTCVRYLFKNGIRVYVRVR